MHPVVVDSEASAKIIDNLKMASAVGTDKINTKFSKNTKMYLSIIVFNVFSPSL